jgi:DNA-binding response OmpR family regulator
MKFAEVRAFPCRYRSAWLLMRDQAGHMKVIPFRVLVVEDNPGMRQMLATLLAVEGFDVVAVSTLQTALQALTAEAPDALITDIGLDGYSGLQLLTMCPRLIPAIVVTGLSDPDVEREARQLGAEYLLKPVDPAVLLEALRRKLGGGDEDARYSAERKSARRPVGAQVHVQGEEAARLVDVSYGGLRLEIERSRGSWLPLAFNVEFPSSQVSVPVDVVWKRRSGDHTWLCGAAVPPDHQQTWREFVDDLVSVEP